MRSICIHVRDSKCKIYVALFCFWGKDPTGTPPLNPSGTYVPQTARPRLLNFALINFCLLVTPLFT